MNAAEQFTARLCEKAFLMLWSYPNPRGKGANELCDVLVVCDRDVMIISVKEIGLSNADDPVQVDR